MPKCFPEWRKIHAGLSWNINALSSSGELFLWVTVHYALCRTVLQIIESFAQWWVVMKGRWIVLLNGESLWRNDKKWCPLFCMQSVQNSFAHWSNTTAKRCSSTQATLSREHTACNSVSGHIKFDIVCNFYPRYMSKVNAHYERIDPRNGVRNSVPGVDSIVMCIVKVHSERIDHRNRVSHSVSGVNPFNMRIYFAHVTGVIEHQ